MHRIAAIARADFLIRFRRTSTLVVFLLLSASAYLWVPPPSTGRAILAISGRRALYNSAALGMATATLGSIFVGLFGFYVISNAIKRDAQSRVGYVLASTSTATREYLLGKFLGNVVFLTTFMLGFMLTSMAMVVVRGEAPLQPFVFAQQYLILVPSVIAFVSAVALVFEATPYLDGRFGDVVYFFFWAFSIGIVASLADKGRGAWLRYFDYNGFAYLFTYLRDTLHTNSVAIGGTDFDTRKPLLVFDGLHVNASWFAARVGSTLTPLPLLGIAALTFHRFDPARLRGRAMKANRGWIARFNALVKPFARAAFAAGAAGRRSATWVDAMATIGAFPLMLVAIAAVALVSATSSAQSFLPIAFAIVGVAVADIATREKRSGTTALVYAAPRLRERFVLWKLGSTLVVAVLFLAVPLMRVASRAPRLVLPFVIGAFFVSAAAVSLGVISANPKTFVALFLSFWYVVINDKGATAAFDFAGFYGHANVSVMAAYAACAIALLATAEAAHRYRLRN